MARWLIPLLLLSTTVFAVPWKGPTTWTGKVVGVSDGDTIQVMHEGKAFKIRLYGVDAPEKDQPFGQKAKQFTSQLVFGKEAKVEVKGTDHWGRVVGEVRIDGKSLGHELLWAGFAWWYQQYTPKNRKLSRLEARAKQAKRGLWADANPTPPWEWRKGKRAGHQLGVLKGNKVGEVYGTPAVDVTHPVVGNTRSKVAHWFTCPDLANCKHCSATFTSGDEAQAAGYRPHLGCIGVGSALKCSSPPGGPCIGDDSCRSDKDCTTVAKHRCDCPPCYKDSVWVVNRAAAERWRRHRATIKVKCRQPECAKCPQRLEPFCEKGHCGVREIRL